MTADDPDMDAILFLDRHPGWTYRDLMECPDAIVQGLRMLANQRAAQA